LLGQKPMHGLMNFNLYRPKKVFWIRCALGRQFSLGRKFLISERRQKCFHISEDFLMSVNYLWIVILFFIRWNYLSAIVTSAVNRICMLCVCFIISIICSDLIITSAQISLAVWTWKR